MAIENVWHSIFRYLVVFLASFSRLNPFIKHQLCSRHKRKHWYIGPSVCTQREKHILQGAIGAYLHIDCVWVLAYWKAGLYRSVKKWEATSSALSANIYIAPLSMGRKKWDVLLGVSYLSVRWFSILHTCHFFLCIHFYEGA